MIAYVDSSVIIPEIVPAGRRWKGLGACEALCSSELLPVEARRAFLRLHRQNQMTDEGLADAMARLRKLVERIDDIDLTRSILRRAGEPFAIHVKTLDALHLASALAYERKKHVEVTFVTADRRQAAVARTLGMQAIEVG